MLLASSGSYVYLFDVTAKFIQTEFQTMPTGFYQIDFDCQFTLTEKSLEMPVGTLEAL
jgi:hypothetical protein